MATNTKIERAETILKKWHTPLYGIPNIELVILTEAMKEYATQFIDLAAEIADFTIESYSSAQEGSTMEIDKESILQIKKIIR